MVRGGPELKPRHVPPRVSPAGAASVRRRGPELKPRHVLAVGRWVAGVVIVPIMSLEVRPEGAWVPPFVDLRVPVSKAKAATAVVKKGGAVHEAGSGAAVGRVHGKGRIVDAVGVLVDEYP